MSIIKRNCSRRHLKRENERVNCFGNRKSLEPYFKREYLSIIIAETTGLSLEELTEIQQ